MFILKLRTLRGRELNKPAQVWKTTKDMQLLSLKRWWQNSGNSLKDEQPESGAVTSVALPALHPFAEERFLVRTVMRVGHEHGAWLGVWEPVRRCRKIQFWNLSWPPPWTKKEPRQLNRDLSRPGHL